MRDDPLLSRRKRTFFSGFVFFFVCLFLNRLPLSMEFSRQQYWNGLPFPPSGDLSDPGIEPQPPA